MSCVPKSGPDARVVVGTITVQPKKEGIAMTGKVKDETTYESGRVSRQGFRQQIPGCFSRYIMLLLLLPVASARMQVRDVELFRQNERASDYGTALLKRSRWW